MSTIITIRMYSGVSDPAWELTPEQEITLKEKLQENKEVTLQQSPSSTGLLGYRGFEIRSTGESEIPNKALVFDSILDIGKTDQSNFIDSNSEIEKYLLETAGVALQQDEKTYVDGEILKNSSGGIANSLKEFNLMAVPPFNPGKWNNNPTVKRNNNCYNYANDKITNTFAQPGRGSGQTGPYPPSCSGTGAAAGRDGQIPVSSASSTPAQGHFIGLVIWPGRDYHWYRLDNNAMWSHKPGQTAARNTDNSGNLISDPQTCNRGPYTEWCGFYHCIPSQIRIR